VYGDVRVGGAHSHSVVPLLYDSEFLPPSVYSLLA